MGRKSNSRKLIEYKVGICPFCQHNNAYSEDIDSDGDVYYYIECPDCFGRTGYENSKKQAIKMWNNKGKIRYSSKTMLEE